MNKNLTKLALLKKVETIQGKVQALWNDVGSDYGNHLQTIGRELNQLTNKIESDEVKPRRRPY